jgi:dihydrofolate synthase / folylpolyglutamate synthase
MNYSACLAYLDSLGHELRGIRFGLEAITTILETLGQPHRKYPTAIVAGTNGKGSATAILANIVRSAGYRTGHYTSPHLVWVNERIRVDGHRISDDEFAAVFTDVVAAVDRLLENHSLSQRPSFFEYLTAAAFLHFARCQVNFVVLEVGMGGRLDATNVTDPLVAIITSIDLDHTEYLGDTVAKIAAEKAGVIRPQQLVVMAEERPEAAEVIREKCAALGATLVETSSFAQVQILKDRGGRYSFNLQLGDERFPNLVCPMLGKFQVQNSVAAFTAGWLLGRHGLKIPRSALVAGLRRGVWPGRLEVVSQRPLAVLDGAHNPAAAREVAAFIREEWKGKRMRLVYASMRDKDIAEITHSLFPLAQEIYLTQPDNPRAATPQEILQVSHADPAVVRIEADPVAAFKKALQASSAKDVVLAAGSLFLVGALKKWLVEKKAQGRPILDTGEFEYTESL